MHANSFLTLFAQTKGSDLPVGTAIAMLLFFGAVGVVSLAGLFASNETLASMAGVIGTKNPLVARIVCALGLLVGGVAVLVTGLSLAGVL